MFSLVSREKTLSDQGDGVTTGKEFLMMSRKPHLVNRMALKKQSRGVGDGPWRFR